MKMEVSLREDRVRIKVGGNSENPIIQENFFFNLGKKDRPLARRLKGRDEESVIPSGISPDNGGGGIAPDSVRAKPLLADSPFKALPVFATKRKGGKKGLFQGTTPLRPIWLFAYIFFSVAPQGFLHFDPK